MKTAVCKTCRPMDRIPYPNAATGREVLQKLLDALLNELDPEKVFFVVGHKLTGQEGFLVKENTKFDIYYANGKHGIVWGSEEIRQKISYNKEKSVLEKEKKN